MLTIAGGVVLGGLILLLIIFLISLGPEVWIGTLAMIGYGLLTGIGYIFAFLFGTLPGMIIVGLIVNWTFFGKPPRKELASLPTKAFDLDKEFDREPASTEEEAARFFYPPTKQELAWLRFSKAKSTGLTQDDLAINWVQMNPFDERSEKVLIKVFKEHRIDPTLRSLGIRAEQDISEYLKYLRSQPDRRPDSTELDFTGIKELDLDPGFKEVPLKNDKSN